MRAGKISIRGFQSVNNDGRPVSPRLSPNITAVPRIPPIASERIFSQSSNPRIFLPDISPKWCERFFRRLYSDPETYLQSVALPLFLLSALLESVQSVFWLYLLDIPEVFPEVEGSPYLEDAEFCVLLDIELLALELILLCALEEAFCEGELPPQSVIF